MSNKAKNNQMGWYSKTLSEADGSINTEIKYIFNIEEQASKFNIVFSKTRNEYAVDFDIEITNLYHNFAEETRETQTYEIRGNEKIVFSLEELPVFGETTSIAIKIHKWSKAVARAKIISMYLQEMLEYTDNDIVSLSTTKELNLLNESLPSKQIDLTLLDIDGDYNIFNPQRRISKSKYEQ